MGHAILPITAPPNPGFPALGRFGKYIFGNGATHDTTNAFEMFLALVPNDRL